MGAIADKFTPKVVIPIATTLLGTSLLMFSFVEEPSSVLSYFLWCFQDITFELQSLAQESFYSRNVSRDVRGTLLGIFYATGLVGRMAFYKVSAPLFSIGP